MKNTLEGKTEAMTQTSFSNEDIESACLLQDCQSERSYEYYDSPIATSNIVLWTTQLAKIREKMQLFASKTKIDVFFKKKIPWSSSYDGACMGKKEFHKTLILSFEVIVQPPILTCHSSEIEGLCLMKCSRETLQNLTYFWNTKTHIVYFVFHFTLLYFSPNECTDLCQHIPGHSFIREKKSSI